MTKELSLLDFSIIVFYLFGVMCLGYYFYRRKQNTTEKYFAAKRSIPGWATLTMNKTIDLGRFNSTLHKLIIGVLGHFVLFGFGLAASLFNKDVIPANRTMTYWG